ncbi:LacI family DNA-binding transcriptional regulator [Vallitalea guaymasensis]|uniref:LacI family DNA-binding transcriptional regulator n=1 Tax=Vallitalea guaymasensis TaxID=1185412 RepID=UPI00272DAB65|nr:LacI family DNA-binding transcriptional regulator [Vallitalea guaymasensis]
MSTINDVSKLAGVSKSTVSNVFNNTKYVSEEITDRVLKAAQELNYYPNKLATGLANKKTYMIGLFLENLGEFRSMHHQIIEGVAMKLNEFNYNVILYIDRDNEKIPKGAKLRIEPIDGAIILDPEIEDIRIKDFVSSGTPIVLVGKAPKSYENLSSLDVDNIEIAYSATKMLIKNGHEKIAFINSKPNLTITSDRLKGYIKALSENQIDFEPSYIYNCDNTIIKAKKLAGSILEKGEFSAIITESDVVALGVYEEAKAKGINIPGDISVFALGGMDYFLTPEVSRVVVDYKKLGEAAAKQITMIIDNNQQSSNLILNEYKIIKTGSVGQVSIR